MTLPTGPARMRVIDSHTGGEPTRLILEGGPDLGTGTLAERLNRFRQGFDPYRSAVTNEPRGSDPVVGALLCPPHDPSCQFGVIFFNNVGYLGMCGHGTIGLVASLAHLGRVKVGRFRIDTPVGVVEAELHANNEVSVSNVTSFRKAKDVSVKAPGLGEIHGDVAWAGNWFFLVDNWSTPIERTRIDELTTDAWHIRQALNARKFPKVDHIELSGPSATPGVDSRNFVLCPGKAYDRSPCGTGTSAKLACLAADNKLPEGKTWVQESVIGSIFKGTYRWTNQAKGEIAPTITGRAFVTAEAELILNPEDPFRWGIP